MYKWKTEQDHIESAMAEYCKDNKIERKDFAKHVLLKEGYMKMFPWGLAGHIPKDYGKNVIEKINASRTKKD